jgi:hypothetical protein
VRELGPRKLAHVEDVVDEFDQLVGALPHVHDLGRLRYGGEVFPNMMRTAAGWRDDVVESREVPHEQRFSCRSVAVASAVAHRLAAARLVERVGDFDTEALEELERGDADLGKERVDIAGDEQRSFHRVRLGVRVLGGALAHASTR